MMPMMPVKKMVALLAVLLLLPLAGCGGQAGGPVAEQRNDQLRLYVGPVMDSWLNGAIARYREAYPEVEVVVDDHSGDGWGTDREAVRTELMAGRGPDVIFRPDSYFDDVRKAMESGAFADLTPLIEADPDFHREDFFESVMAAGVYREKQYVMPLTFNLPLLLSSEEALDEAEIQMENCGDYLGLAEEVDRFLREGREMRVYNHIQFGTYYPTFLGISFLNYEDRTVDFTAPEFARAAELYRRLYPQDVPDVDTTYISTMDGYNDVMGRKAVFGLYNAMSGEELFLNASAISAKETPVLLPVRAVDGGNTALVFMSAAISSMSPNRQNAYQFIKLLLSEEWQNDSINSPNMPMRRSCLENQIQNAKEMTNNQVFDVGDGNTTPLPPLPESFYEEYRTALNEVSHADFLSGFLPGEVLSYLAPYYRGEKSFETCLAELESAMKIYMTE